MDLKENISIVWDTLVKSKVNYDIVKYLNSPTTKEEFEIIKRSIFFTTTAYSLWKLCIIDLHKLFSNSRNDKISIKKLIENIETRDAKEHKITKETISKWNIEITKNETSINTIKYLRDKLYAHSDLNVDKDKELYFNEVLQLLKVAETILMDINRISFDTHLICFPEPDYHNGKCEVNALINEQSMREQEIIRSLQK